MISPPHIKFPKLTGRKVGPGDRSSSSRIYALEGMRVVLEIRVPFWVLFIRVPYYFRGPTKGTLNSELPMNKQ